MVLGLVPEINVETFSILPVPCIRATNFFLQKDCVSSSSISATTNVRNRCQRQSLLTYSALPLAVVMTVGSFLLMVSFPSEVILIMCRDAPLSTVNCSFSQSPPDRGVSFCGFHMFCASPRLSSHHISCSLQ